ncbi:MAG: VOC family protein [Burkholderiales bacterium]|nr:VOC family protein [Burkholderiales bacterium]
MALLGVQSLIYGVDDLEAASRFYDDFGLAATRRDAAVVEYTLEDGASVVLRRNDDPALPARFTSAPGVREVIWGVDTSAALEALGASLAADRKVTRDADGTLHTTDASGIAIGFRVFARKPLEAVTSTENAPGQVRRWNEHRRWVRRAQPRCMNHVVFGVPDVDAAATFYRERLGFRVTDVSRGLGVFLRCDGRAEHHSIFFLKTGIVSWHHVAFAVQNIDEVMVGADHMQRCGWKSDLGVGRHRISSSVFYYVNNPAGGMSEYSADTDYLTDAWQPRLWEPKFGNWHWVGKVPDAFMNEPDWDVSIIDDPTRPFAELSAGAPAAKPMNNG